MLYQLHSGLDAIKAMILPGKSYTANELAFQFQQKTGPRNKPSDNPNNHLDSRSPYRKQFNEKLVTKAIEICYQQRYVISFFLLCG